MARFSGVRPDLRHRFGRLATAGALAIALLAAGCGGEAPSASDGAADTPSEPAAETAAAAATPASDEAPAGNEREIRPAPGLKRAAGTPSVAENPVRAFRFAGVDLLYALRRIAANGDAVLCVDEVRGPEGEHDLQVRRLDMDLPAGTLDEAVRELQERAGGFDYAFFDKVLYVRSRLTVEDRTPLDIKFIPGAIFEGHLVSLSAFIMRLNPRSFLKPTKTIGEPVFRKVQFTIPDNSSIRDVFIAYAQALDHGWILRRSGQIVPHGAGEAYVATTIDLLRPLDEPEYLRPPMRRERTILHALADVTERTLKPILVLDRSSLGDMRGDLYFKHGDDPKLPLQQSLEHLVAGEAGREDNYSLDFQGEVPVVRSYLYDYLISGKQILRQPLEAGEFEGSLPELGRWLNARLPEELGMDFQSGEILGSEPNARIAIDEGMSVQQVLERFAAASGDSPVVTIVWPADTSPRVDEEDPRWKGARLQALREWSLP